TVIQGYIDTGWITGYDTENAVIMDYDVTNTGKTTIVGDPDYNAPPVVDAGSYQSALLSAGAQMAAIVDDDGRPDPPATLTYTWSEISGPGDVSFNPSNAVENPTAMFTAAGFYELQLSVSDSEKDACDVVTIYVRPDDNPIAHWDFEEGLGGSDVLDVNGNDGVIAGDLEPNWVSGWVEDWAMEFYASGDTTVSSYVDITSNISAADPNLDNLRYDVTLSAWFKIGNLAVTSSPVIVANGDQGWRLYANHGDGTIIFTPGDGVAHWQNRTTSTMSMDDGYWHHVVGMYDYTNSKSYLYIDGVLEPDAISEDHTGMMAEADDKPVSIGARWNIVEEELVAERGWNGLIDDVRVYSYCISEAKITELAGMGDLVPQVDAGLDQAVSLQDGAVQLAGTATDDGEPNPSLAIEWSKVSGIGTVTFDPCDAAVATATFSEADTYVLRLTADDGNAEVFDEVTITVSDPTCQDVIDDGLLKASDISGPEGTPDCYVDLYDFAAFAGEWLSCNDPQDLGCESPY
ncbi:MAG: LamG domain-containing protein, partial [Sedimentisphaerales bacterium]|nr:LamG domain-containing protein [Sedimentisphaerales bacterium]